MAITNSTTARTTPPAGRVTSTAHTAAVTPVSTAAEASSVLFSTASVTTPSSTVGGTHSLM